MIKRKRPHILYRIISGYIILFLFFLLASLFYLNKIKNTNIIVNNIIKHPYTVSNSSRNVNVYINAMHRTMKDVALAESEEQLIKEIEKVDSLEKLAQEQLQIIKANYLGNIDDVVELQNNFNNWNPIREEVIQKVRNNNRSDAIKITQHKCAIQVDLLIANSQKLIDFASTKALEFNNKAQDSLKHSYQVSFIVTLIALLFLLTLMVIGYQSVNKPLKEIVERIRKVSKISVDSKIPNKEKNILVILDYAIHDLEIKTLSLQQEIEEKTATEEELSEHKMILEDTIEERTKELKAELERRRIAENELKNQHDKLEKLVQQRTEVIQKKNQKLKESKKAMVFLLEDVNEGRALLANTNESLKSTINDLEAFSYSVSHDLKAPLRAIVGFSQILIEDYASQLKPEAKEYVELINKNAKNMGVLINDLLNFSRMGRKALQKQKVDINDIAKRVQQELLVALPDRKIMIKIKPMPLANADETLIYLVMQNLISNALKFTAIDKNPLVEIGSFLQNEKNVFYVKDNGIGFDMKYAEKIFDVFQRLHNADEYQGTGIGLAIVQRIIQKHGGKIWVESEKNKGSTFFFIL